MFYYFIFEIYIIIIFLLITLWIHVGKARFNGEGDLHIEFIDDVSLTVNSSGTIVAFEDKNSVTLYPLKDNIESFNQLIPLNVMNYLKFIPIFANILQQNLL